MKEHLIKLGFRISLSHDTYERYYKDGAVVILTSGKLILLNTSHNVLFDGKIPTIEELEIIMKLTL